MSSSSSLIRCLRPQSTIVGARQFCVPLLFNSGGVRYFARDSRQNNNHNSALQHQNSNSAAARHRRLSPWSAFDHDWFFDSPFDTFFRPSRSLQNQNNNANDNRELISPFDMMDRWMRGNDWPSSSSSGAFMPMSRVFERPMPTMHVEETEKEVIVNVDVPGVKKEEIKISVSGDEEKVLTITGERKQQFVESVSANGNGNKEKKENANKTDEKKSDQQQQQSEQQQQQQQQQQRPTIRRHAYGKFTRSITLPDYVDADNISAKCQDGVLTITLPKRAPPKETTHEKVIQIQ